MKKQKSLDKLLIVEIAIVFIGIISFIIFA
jgi:hypothetical protein